MRHRERERNEQQHDCLGNDASDANRAAQRHRLHLRQSTPLHINGNSDDDDERCGCESGHVVALRATGNPPRAGYRVTVTAVVALVAAPVSSTASTRSSAETPPKSRSSGTSLRGLKR